MQSAGVSMGPMHQIWVAPEIGGGGSSTGQKDTSVSVDSMEEMRRQTIEAQLEGIVQHSESFTSELSDSDQESMMDLFDVNAVRMKILKVQSRLAEGKDTPEDSKWAEAMLQVAEQGEELEEEEEEGDQVRERVGSWSLGSKRHAAGNCRPCHYVNTKIGCTNGADCPFCHLDHPRRLRPRPCKSKRTRCKQLAGMLDTVFANDPDQLNQAVELLSKQNAYLRAVVKSKVRNLMSNPEGEEDAEGNSNNNAGESSVGAEKSKMSL